MGDMIPELLKIVQLNKDKGNDDRNELGQNESRSKYLLGISGGIGIIGVGDGLGLILVVPQVSIHCAHFGIILGPYRTHAQM